MNSFPFFITGCVRSGTTMLRKILCLHERLECPEETHFFRWADPFGTNRYEVACTKSNVITKHQKMDGFSQKEFMGLYQQAGNRRELMDEYMRSYLTKKNNQHGRWFDKSPQHVYGLFLIKDMYPDARFIHIHRNPLNVAVSLMKGKVMPRQSLIGAVNYWNESMILMQGIMKAFPKDVLEIKYEEFCDNPHESMELVFSFIDEDMSDFSLPKGYTRSEKNQYKSAMDDDQIAFVEHHCGRFMRQYGYLD